MGILGAVGGWLAVRSMYPAGEVNYVNYCLLRTGLNIDDVEALIGPYRNERIVDVSTGRPSEIPDDLDGEHELTWYDTRKGVLFCNSIHLTFSDGRLIKKRWRQPPMS
jgi:hypothetical protein